MRCSAWEALDLALFFSLSLFVRVALLTLLSSSAVGEAIEALSNAVDERDEGKVMECLQAPVLEIEGLDDSAGAFYVSELATLQDSLPEEEFFTVSDFCEMRDLGTMIRDVRKMCNEQGMGGPKV